MGLWILFIECCCSASVFRDQVHSSSLFRTRPDATICKKGAVVIKHEAKASLPEMDNAENELLDKLSPQAVSQFPRGSKEIVGITTCATLVRMYRIYFDDSTNSFKQKLLKEYPMNFMSSRISFIIDIAKLCRWIIGISGPNSESIWSTILELKQTTNTMLLGVRMAC